MVIKAVLLDFGGTLAEGRMNWDEFHRDIQSVLKALDHTVDLRRLKSAIASALENLKRVRARGDELTLEQVYGMALYRLGIPTEERALELIHDAFRRRYEETLYGCTEDVVKRLSGRYRLALISNTMSDKPRLTLRETGLIDHFQVVVCSRDLGIRKPNPRIFMHVLEALGVEPGEAVHVGDSIEADMEGATGVGITPIWIEAPRGDIWNGLSIPNICQLPELLSRLE
jgi:HAD superfamily hydrolase (TIGR01549 family)